MLYEHCLNAERCSECGGITVHIVCAELDPQEQVANLVMVCTVCHQRIEAAIKLVTWIREVRPKVYLSRVSDTNYTIQYRKRE